MKRLLFALACVALAACSHGAVAGPKIDPALALVIPADTTLLVGTRLEDIEKTDVYKKHLAGRSIPQIDAFAKETQVDPRKELWELLYISNGKQGALLGRGKFADDGEPRIPKGGLGRFAYKGYNFVGDDRTAVLLLSPTAVGYGDTAELRAMVDAKEKSVGPASAMAELLKEIPPSSQAWAAYRGGPVELPLNPKSDPTGNLGNAARVLSLIQTGTFYFDFSMGVKGLGTGSGNNEQDAADLEGALKALVGFGRLATSPKQPELQRLWDGLTVTREARVVKLHIEEPAELVDGALNLVLGKK
jgi:hypothetical protein